MQEISFKKSILFILLFMLISFFINNISFTNENFFSKIYIFSYLGWGILILINIYFVKSLKKPKYYFTIVLFITVGFLFNYGQMLLIPLKNKTEILNMYSFKYLNLNLIIRTIKYSLQILIWLAIGIMSSLLFYSNSNRDTFKEKRKIIRAIKILNKISFFPFWYVFILKLYVVLFKGYNASYTYNYGVFNFIEVYYLVTLIGLLLLTNTKKYFKIIFCIALLSFGLGSRTQAISLILVLIYKKIYQGEKIINFKFFFYFLTIVLVVPLIAKIRSNYSELFSDTEKIFYEVYIKNNPLISFIDELGGSMRTTALTINLIPQKRNYLYGMTLVDTIMKMVPSFIRNFYYTNLEIGEVWLTRVLKTTYGLGFSTAAESYLNFGRYGFLYSLILGFIIGNLLMYKERNYKQLFINGGIFLFLFILPRTDSSYSLIRVWYYIGIPYIFIMILQKSGDKK